MAIEADIPGYGRLRLEHLVLDQNGTLSYQGELIDGVAERLRTLRKQLSVHILTADTLGTLELVAAQLGVSSHRVDNGMGKRQYVERLGAERCAVIGNGRNDVPMLEVAPLSIAVAGPEGLSTAALEAAHIVCGSIVSALDLLRDSRLLVAALRS